MTPRTARRPPLRRVRDRRVRPTRRKWRWMVRSFGAQPLVTAMIWQICAAVRSGFSRLQGLGQSNISAGTFGDERPQAGLSASNPPGPPRPDPLVQRGTAHPDLRPVGTGMELGTASSRTSRPRSAVAQRRIGRLADQGVTEQGHLGGSIPRCTVPPSRAGPTIDRQDRARGSRPIRRRPG